MSSCAGWHKSILFAEALYTFLQSMAYLLVLHLRWVVYNNFWLKLVLETVYIHLQDTCTRACVHHGYLLAHLSTKWSG